MEALSVVTVFTGKLAELILPAILAANGIDPAEVVDLN